MKKELDKETKKIISENERVERFVNSDDWGLIKKKLYNKLITIDSIASMPKNMKMEEFYMDCRIREGAISLVLEWIKEIEGEANKAKWNEGIMEEIRKDSIIQYF